MMKETTRWVLYCLGILLLFSTCFAGYFFYQVALIGTAYKAKILCSGVFVAERRPESLLTQDLSVDDLSPLRYISADIDYERRSVTAAIFGLAKRKAIFRKGLGCTLVIDRTEEELLSQAASFHTEDAGVPSDNKDHLWPEGELVQTEDLPPGINAGKLHEAIEESFSEPDPDRMRRTRAVVVVYKGRIVAERYAEGFSHETPLIGWSMTKSVMNALVGILVEEGKLSIKDRGLLKEWNAPEDRRGEITLDNLLRMTSGLKFSEDYGNPLKDVIHMLLGTGAMGAYAADKPLEATPGSRWQYSSGSTNIIARIIRDEVGGTDKDYFAFPHTALFERIGMKHAVIEPDAAGTFVGSSFMYATARDWARVGLLYLRQGVWNGERILPEGWVKYTLNPTPGSDGAYGAHFWLEVPAAFKKAKESTASLPSDIYFASGHEGQFITVIPSRELVIVRLGLSRLEHSWNHESFVSMILEAFPDR